jgi:ABC-type Co2+ transport system permease subunit
VALPVRTSNKLPALHLTARHSCRKELGHHATRATKFAFVTMWLALPWRFASRLVIGIALATVGRRQPLRLLAVVVLAGVVVAVVQAVQQRQWAVAALLSAVAVCAVVYPLVDAAVSRRCEYAADRYAAGVGLGPQLAAALPVLDGGSVVGCGCGW